MAEYPPKRIPPRRVVHPQRRRLENEPLKVLAHVHKYPPYHNAGAEWMLHGMLRYGVEERGWEVQVVTDQGPERSDTFEGIKVRHDRRIPNLQVDYRFSQVIITHLDVTQKAMDLTRRNGRPLVHLVHNDQQLRYHGVDQRRCALAVFNSEWLRDAVAWPGRSMVVYPPTRLEHFHIDSAHGGEITLVNLSAAKGAAVFYELAARLPQYKFLGVMGGYAHQEPAPNLPNLTIIGNQPDIRTVFERSRIILMPSGYESWGRVACEAACSGIPSICAPTPGLIEAGVADAFVDVSDVDGWQAEVERLMESGDEWAEASARAIERATELDALVDAQLAEWADAMESL